MGLLDYFKIPSEKENMEHKKSLVNKIVRIFSRGDYDLSVGNYITQEDHERMKQEAGKYKFS